MKKWGTVLAVLACLLTGCDDGTEPERSSLITAESAALDPEFGGGITTQKTSGTLVAQKPVTSLKGIAGKRQPAVVSNPETAQNPVPEKKLSDATGFVQFREIDPIDALNAEPKSDGLSAPVRRYYRMPSASYVSAFLEPTKEYLWQPVRRHDISEASGNAWMGGYFTSSDNAIVGVIEKRGEQSGPYGARVVILNMYTSDVMNVFTLDEDDVLQMIFDEKRASSIGLTRRQNGEKELCVIEVPYALGSVTTRYTVGKAADAVLDFAYDYAQSQVLLRTTAAPDELRIYNLHDTAFVPQRLKIEAHAPLAFDFENRLVCAYERGRITRYDMDTLSLRGDFETKLNAIERMVYLSGGEMLVFTADRAAYSLSPVRTIQLSKACSGVFAYDVEADRIFLEEKARAELKILKGELRELEDAFEPRKMRPIQRTSARYIAYLPIGNRLFYADETGRLYLLQKLERTWRKILIYDLK